MTSPDLLQAALSLAAQGLAVFPLHYPVQRSYGLVCSCDEACSTPAKHPFGKLAHKGVYDATTDTAQIKAWWHPGTNYNIGVAATSMLVLDVDPRKRGYESLAALEEANDIVPHSWCVITGSNGRHIFLKLPADTKVTNSAGQLGQGLDIRTDGGYVVGPGSTHISGNPYRWLFSPDEAPLAEAPTWLIEKLKPPAPAPRPAAGRPISFGDIGERITAILLKVAQASVGERNQLTFWGAYTLRDLVREGVIDHVAGMDALEQLRLAAAHAGLADREINQTITSALRGKT
jgi:hypothetical protein